MLVGELFKCVNSLKPGGHIWPKRDAQKVSSTEKCHQKVICFEHVKQFQTLSAHP